MGTKKKAKQAHRKAVERLDHTEQVMADTAVLADRRLAELDDLVSRTNELADQLVEALRSAVQEAEGHRATIEDATQRAERSRAAAEDAWEVVLSTTTAELASHARQHLVAIDRQSEAEAALLEARRVAVEQELTAVGDRAVADLHARAQELVSSLERSRVSAFERVEALDTAIAQRTEELDAAVPLSPIAAEAAPAEAPEPDPAHLPVVAEMREAPSSCLGEPADDADSLAPLAWVPTVPPVPTVAAPAVTAPAVTAPTITATPAPSPSEDEAGTSAVIAEPPASTASVAVNTSRSQITASLTQLARSAADGWVFVELVHKSRDGEPSSALRLTVQDSSGWWEYHDVGGSASALSRRSAVVDLRELLQAIELDRHGGDLLELDLGSDITIGPVLVLARRAPMPQFSGERRKIERVDLGGPGRTHLVIDSQVGRLVVPSRLTSLLRSRRAEDVELVTIDGQPCLSASTSNPPHGVAATIVAPLTEDDESASQQPSERRAEDNSAISQLIGALSSTSSPDELASIVATGIGYARRRAAAHPALPAGLIAEMLRDGTEAMRSAAASNPSIPVTSIERAAADDAPAVRAAVAGNPSVPPAILIRLAHDDSTQVRVRVVGNPSLPIEMLSVLGDDPDAGVRTAVAAHERCPLDTLVTMAHDSSPAVCAAAAENTNCPVDLLDELLAVVPEVVLTNPRAPEHLLVAGSQVRSPQLRAAVAANPSTPVRQLQLLGRDPDPLVALAVASNPSAPASVRRRARRRTERTETAPESDTDAVATLALT